MIYKLKADIVKFQLVKDTPERSVYFFLFIVKKKRIHIFLHVLSDCPEFLIFFDNTANLDLLSRSDYVEVIKSLIPTLP